MAAADKKVATAKTATLTCAITGITTAVTVTWKNAAGADVKDEDEYTVSAGSLSSTKQDSTLEITSTGLASLAGTTATFTCIVKSGEFAANSPEVSDTTILTKLTFGTYYDFHYIYK